MATKLQDLQAKRKELQATNQNATMLDAKLALSPAPIANAPVAGQAPAITPITPTPVLQLHYQQTNKFLQKIRQKLQGEIQAGTRPEVGQQATQAQTPKIIQQAQNQTMASNLPSQLSAQDQATIDRMTAEGRFTPPEGTRTPSGATMNADGTVTNVTDLINKEQNRGYSLAEGEKKLTERRLNEQATPTDKKGILNALVTGQPVTPTNTPEYRKASAIHTGFQKFNGMTDVQLLDNLKQGQITTEMGSLLASNPNYQIAKKKLDDIQSTQATNNTMNYLKTGIAGKTVDTPNYLESLSNDLVKKYGLVDQSSQDAFKEIVSNDPEVVDYTKQLHEINRQVADTTQLINDGMKEFKQNYQGKLSASEMLNYMGNRFRDATDNLNALNNTKTYLTADLKNATDMAIAEYGAVQTDIARNQAVRDKFMQQEMALQGNMAQMQMEADFAKKQAEENLNNPAIAIENVMNEYKKLGIPFTSTIQSRLQEFANSGKSLPDYLTQMTESIQASPAYQQYKEMKAGELTDREKMDLGYAQDIAKLRLQSELGKTAKTPKWAQDINGNWYNENSSTSPAEQIGNGTVDIGEGTLLDVLGKNVGTYTGNRGYDLAGNLGDPLPAGGNWKVIATDTAGEQVGSIFKGGKGSKPYGNTVVMEDENGNQIRYSHLQDIGVQKGDTLGFGTVIGTRGNTGNVLGANGEKLTAEQLAQGRGAHVDIEIKDKNGRLLSNEEQKNYLAGIKKPESTQNLSIYRSYVEDGKLPSKDALKGLGMTSQQFINNADAGYTQFLDKKAKEISDTYPTLDIAYTPTFASNSATQKEKLNDSITKIGDIDMRITKLKKLFDENGTETWPTKAKAEMTSLRQQIILKAKEVENLGVLNGPDLGILENLLPATTGFWSGVGSFDANTKTKLDSLQNNYRSDAKTKAVNYGAKISFTDDPVEKELANSFPK